MIRRRARLVASALTAIVLSSIAASAEADDTKEQSYACRFTRRQAVGLAALSGVLSLGSFYVDYLPNPRLFGDHDWYRYPTEMLSGVPLFVPSVRDGIGVESFLALGVGSSIALRHLEENGSPTALPYAVAAENISLHVALFGTYAAYRDARLQGSDPAWNDDWRPASASELVAAPFKMKNLDHDLVKVPLLLETGFFGLLTAGNIALKGAPPAGKIVRDATLGTALSFSAGVTEEAFFRGVLYEELKLSLGRWPAGAIDSTLFSLAHVPGEIGVQGTGAIVAGIAYRGAFSLLAEAAYDEGGLVESVALHSIWDSVAFVSAALLGEHPLGGSLSLPRPSSSSSLVSGSRSPRTANLEPTVVPLLSGPF